MIQFIAITLTLSYIQIHPECQQSSEFLPYLPPFSLSSPIPIIIIISANQYIFMIVVFVSSECFNRFRPFRPKHSRLRPFCLFRLAPSASLALSCLSDDYHSECICICPSSNPYLLLLVFSFLPYKGHRKHRDNTVFTTIRRQNTFIFSSFTSILISIYSDSNFF